MKTIAFAIALLGIMLPPRPTLAGEWNEEHEYYKTYERHEYRHHPRYHQRRHEADTVVIEIRPRRHVPAHRRECWTEESRYYPPRRSHDAAAGMIAGGIIGGVIGHEMGRGSRRDTLAVLGTLIGASVGHDMAARHGDGGQWRSYRRHCRRLPHRHPY